MAIRMLAGLSKRLPMMAVGIAAALWIYGRVHGGDWTSVDRIPAALCGAMLGLFLWPDVRGLMAAGRTGAGREIGLQAFVGAVLGGIVALVVSWTGAAQDDLLVWLTAGTWLQVALRGATIGAGLALLRFGEAFQDRMRQQQHGTATSGNP